VTVLGIKNELHVLLGFSISTTMSADKHDKNDLLTSDNINSSPVSLALAKDFNRNPGEWPEGVPKWHFPHVYPKYADSSPSSNHSGQSAWHSTPTRQDNKQTSKTLNSKVVNPFKLY
jgi:hypothetical protein